MTRAVIEMQTSVLLIVVGAVFLFCWPLLELRGARTEQEAWIHDVIFLIPFIAAFFAGRLIGPRALLSIAAISLVAASAVIGQELLLIMGMEGGWTEYGSTIGVLEFLMITVGGSTGLAFIGLKSRGKPPRQEQA
jgi:hypothetical protein